MHNSRSLLRWINVVALTTTTLMIGLSINHLKKRIIDLGALRPHLVIK